MSQITLSKTALFSLLRSATFSDDGWPDKPGPWGPVIRAASLGSLVAGPFPEPWRQLSRYALPRQITATGPFPDPWKGIALARSVISDAVARFQLAEALVGANGNERASSVIGSQIREVVDDFCGNGRPRIPLPKPNPPGPWELLTAAAEFAAAAEIEGPLQTSFAAASEECLKGGLQRFEKGTG